MSAPAAVISGADTGWVFVSTALVLLMVPGLALFYGGLVRARAAVNTFMMSIAALAVVSVQWVLVGYSLAFSPGGIVGGHAWFGLLGVGAAPGPYSPTIPHLAFVAFQAMFAGITVALVSGAVVERIRFHLYLVFALLWTTLVYDPLAHWVWGTDGWLHKLGALDFAGGTVVHISAGTAALVAAIILGRRSGLGRRPLIPHNVPYTLLGAGLLWVGWLGFNAGSALAADAVAAVALVNTHAAAAAALVAWVVIELLRNRQATAVGAATGAVVGLVAITPAAGYVTPLSALAIGVLAAGASYLAMNLRARTKIDDALDVFACHGVAGIAGALLTGVFATKAVNAAGADGLLFGNARLLGVQALAVLCTVVLSGAVTGLVLWGLGALASLRLPLHEELTGVDLSQHGEQAYHDDGSAEVAALGGRIDDAVILSGRSEAA